MNSITDIINRESVEKTLEVANEIKREVTEQVKSITRHPQFIPATVAALSTVLVWQIWRRSVVSEEKLEKSQSEKIIPKQSAGEQKQETQTITESAVSEEGYTSGDEIDQKWARHTEEFCRKERVPTIQSYYTSPGMEENKGWQTVRDPPRATNLPIRPKKPTKATPRRVIPPSAKFSAVPSRLSVASPSPRDRSPTRKSTPKASPRTKKTIGSPRTKTTSPYVKKY